VSYTHPHGEAHDPVSLGREVVRACLGLGFGAAGIARAVPSSRGDEVRAWLGAAKHGTMDWMEEYLDERLDVTRLLPGARAVIVVADAYAGPGEDPKSARSTRDASGGSPPTGSIARYARGEDYHAVIKRRLRRLADRLRELPAARRTVEDGNGEARFRAFVDSGPALEREHAARAGLGWVGKHTLLIDPERGSWFVLGGIATTLDIAPDPLHPEVADHCGTCTRCIDACPTQAITPYSVDARLCVSYLTIEHQGLIDPSLHAGIGDRLIGCDVCQEVCPFNGAVSALEEQERHGHGGHAAVVNAAYAPGRGVGAALPLLEVLGWTEGERTRVLSLSAAKRATLAMLKRNALIAAGNAVVGGTSPHDAAALRARIDQIVADEAEETVVRETARQVVGKFKPQSSHFK